MKTTAIILYISFSRVTSYCVMVNKLENQLLSNKFNPYYHPVSRAWNILTVCLKEGSELTDNRGNTKVKFHDIADLWII